MTNILSATERVLVIDDDPNTRAALREHVEDAGLQPIEVSAASSDIDSFVGGFLSQAEAALCDHHLRKKNYAGFNGAEVVAKWYQHRHPAVLCTRWEEANIGEIRRFRRYIPVLLRPSDLNPDSLLAGIEECRQEFRGIIRSERRSWRAVVRIEEIDELPGTSLYVCVAGAATDDVIKLDILDVPVAIRAGLRAGHRVAAMVNVGAERQEDMFFYDWGQ